MTRSSSVIASLLVIAFAVTTSAECAVAQVARTSAGAASDTTIAAHAIALTLPAFDPGRVLSPGSFVIAAGARHESSSASSTRDVARVRETDRSGRVLIGVVVGAVAGAVVGRVVVGDGCRSGFSGCDGGASIMVFTAGGALAGAIIGGTIGALR